jgi:hypothetical protein
MRRFYTLFDAAGHIHLDPTKASTLEVSWWDVHRQRQHDAGVTYDAAVNTLNALYSYVYDAPAELTHKAAALRVDAMDLSDSWVEAGCHLEDPVLAEQRRTLVASYTALRDAMERRFAARRSPAEAE